VVVQVRVLTGPEAPTQRVSVRVEGWVPESTPGPVRNCSTVTVQATAVPPPFISPLHWLATAAALTLAGRWALRPNATAASKRTKATASQPRRDVARGAFRGSW